MKLFRLQEKVNTNSGAFSVLITDATSKLGQDKGLTAVVHQYEGWNTSSKNVFQCLFTRPIDFIWCTRWSFNLKSENLSIQWCLWLKMSIEFHGQFEWHYLNQSSNWIEIAGSSCKRKLIFVGMASPYHIESIEWQQYGREKHQWTLSTSGPDDFYSPYRLINGKLQKASQPFSDWAISIYFLTCDGHKPGKSWVSWSQMEVIP